MAGIRISLGTFQTTQPINIICSFFVFETAAIINATCISWGDPHITPYTPNDYGNTLSSPGVQEPGDFVLATFGPAGSAGTTVYEGQTLWVNGAYVNYQALVQNGGNTVSVLYGNLFINGNPITLANGQSVQVGTIHVTQTATDAYTITTPQGYVQVALIGAGTTSNYTDITVVVTNAVGPLGGLCGSYPGPFDPDASSSSDDDGTKRKRTTAVTRAQFIQSWHVPFEDDPFVYASEAEWLLANPANFPSFGGNPPTQFETLALASCAALLSGPLVNQCGSFDDPSFWYQACLDDVLLSGDARFAQSAVASYSFHCFATAPAGLVIVLPLQPRSSTATILNTADQGLETIFTIQARDVTGNPITTGGYTFIITYTGPDPKLTFTIVDNNDGTYTVSYTATVAGSYEIHIYGSDGVSDIENSPFAVTVIPAVTDAALSIASGAGLGPSINAGVRQIIVVTTYTQWGTLRGTGGDAVAAAFSAGTIAHYVVVDNKDGTYTLEYEQQQPLSFSITITVNGAAIFDSPFSVTAA